MSKKIKKGWVALELTTRGEEQNIQIVKDAILHTLSKDAEVFIPIHYATSNQYKNKIVLLNGYFFIRDDYSVAEFLKLRISYYFEGPVIDFSTKEIHIIDDKEIRKMKRNLKKLTKRNHVYEGGDVVIIDGKFVGLNGIVISLDDNKKHATVKITSLRSMSPLVTLPVLSIEAINEQETKEKE